MVSNVNAKIYIINVPVQCLLEAIRSLQILMAKAMTSLMPARISVSNAMTSPTSQDNFRMTEALTSSTNQPQDKRESSNSRKEN